MQCNKNAACDGLTEKGQNLRKGNSREPDLPRLVYHLLFFMTKDGTFEKRGKERSINSKYQCTKRGAKLEIV